MLQSVVMLAQMGLSIYGIVEVVKTQQADNSYLCGESINVFWTLLGLHFIQNSCVVGKLSKGAASSTACFMLALAACAMGRPATPSPRSRGRFRRQRLTLGYGFTEARQGIACPHPMCQSGLTGSGPEKQSPRTCYDIVNGSCPGTRRLDL